MKSDYEIFTDWADRLNKRTKLNFFVGKNWNNCIAQIENATLFFDRANNCLFDYYNHI